MKKMMKVLSLMLVVFTGYLLLDSQKLLTVFSQRTDGKSNVLKQQDRQSDLRMAEAIERLTNRSAKGLVEELSPNGEVNIDLQERFQNVTLARVEDDGEAVAACVASLGEANAFFGRNLKTGEAVPQMQVPKDEIGKFASEYGMTVEEYTFYVNLIEKAKQNGSLTANANIVIINADGAGEGFNDTTPLAPEGGNPGTTIGQQRLNLFNFAAGIWGAFLDSSVTINVSSKFDPLTCSANSATLGSAGPNQISANFTPQTPGYTPIPNTWYPVALANKIRGFDASPASQEINATFNSSINNDPNCLASRRFYYGFDNTSPSGTTNLLVVLLHEMGHGLGFISFADDTTGAFPTSSGGSTFPDIFSRFTFDRNLNKYWYQMTDAERVTSSTSGGTTAARTPNVFWDGPNVKIASGFLTAGRDAATGRVELHTPNPYDDGSSVSHWTTSAFPNLLMEPIITANLPLTLDLTRQQMRDIGWYRDTDLNLVPDTITNVQVSGATLTVGNQATVTWTNTGGFNRNVTIELSTDGGATFPVAIATDITNTGTHTFTVPNNPTAQARIRVREHNFVEPLGSSATNFTISAAQVLSADLSVTKVDTPDPVNAGTDLTYTISVRNNGPDAASTVTFNDTVPAQTTFVSMPSPAGFNCTTPGVGGTGAINCTATTLAVNTTATFTLVVRVAAGATAGTVISNTATVASATADPNNANNSATATTTVTVCSFTLSSTSFNAPATAGSSTVNVTAGTGCNWTAVSNTAFLTITGGASGTGNGTVTFNFAANTGAARTGTLTIAGQTFTVIQAAASVANVIKMFDYDGDNKTDVSIYRPGANQWWYLRSSDGANRAFAFGATGAKIAPADYTGDGKTDLAFFQPSTAQWFIVRSEDNTFFGFPFGEATDIPFGADFDGDGKADPTVYRPSTQVWFTLKSTGGTLIQQFGSPGDLPVVADYDGDKKADLAIFRPGPAEWWILKSTGGNLVYQFGTTTDKTVPADYTGDGKTDVAFFRPSTGEWFVIRSENQTFFGAPFGTNGDVPVAGDYDADGKADLAVFRPSSNVWFINKSSGGADILPFGQAGDTPTASAYVR